MLEQITNTVQVTVPNNEGIAGTPTVFTFNFSQVIVAPAIEATFRIDEKKVINLPRNITKPLKAVPGNLKEAIAELTFPEALAGATLEIKCSFSGKTITSTPSVTINIKDINDIKEIEKVYWGEQQLASYGTVLPQKREICKNECAFLHIHTKGMFGYNVFAQIREYDNEKDIRPIKNLNVEMQDNVVSIPYSMESAITDFKTKYSTVLEKECLELYARTHQDKTKIDSGQRSPNLFLHYKKEEKNPAKQTNAPPVKVIIAEDEEEQKIPTKAKCSLEFRPKNTYKGDYGFDWVRLGDTNDFGDTQPYKNIVSKQYLNAGSNNLVMDGNIYSGDFRPNVALYNSLRTEYIPLPITWNTVSSVGSMILGEYFCSWFSLFPATVKGKPPLIAEQQPAGYTNKEADLCLYLDIAESPEYLEFSENEHFEITPKKITDDLGLGKRFWKGGNATVKGRKQCNYL